MVGDREWTAWVNLECFEEGVQLVAGLLEVWVESQTTKYTCIFCKKIH